MKILVMARQNVHQNLSAQSNVNYRPNENVVVATAVVVSTLQGTLAFLYVGVYFNGVGFLARYFSWVLLNLADTVGPNLRRIWGKERSFDWVYHIN